MTNSSIKREGQMSENTKELLRKSIVVDGLFNALLYDPPPTEGKKDVIDLFLDGGVTVLNVPLTIDYYKNDFVTYIRQIYQAYLFEEAFRGKVLIIERYVDILKAKKENKLGIILSMQGADPIEHDLRYLSILHKLGLRIIQLTYNQQNNVGCGAYDPHDTGLTRFGQQAIFEMNRLGIIVDVAHVGYRTSLDAIEISKDPVIISHGSAREVSDSPRNFTDEQIRAVAAKGGVMGVCPLSVFCRKKGKTSRPTVNDFIDHVEHIMNLVGEDHVGIGVDRWRRIPTQTDLMLRVEYDRTLPGFFASYPVDQYNVEGFGYYDEWENLVDRLIKRGFSSAQIQKILGGNFCRVFEKVWGKKLKLDDQG